MHILCPHCHNPIELVKLSPHEEIVCASCGSSFHLETESTTAWQQCAGQRLGRFEVLETLGQGAFGTVYKARDASLDRIVALKVPRAGNLAGPQDLARFLREARSAAQLHHPSIVAVHEVDQVDGVPYLVSDFVEGVTLTDWLSARRPAPRQAAELIAAAADALQYAHEQGVVHRDVKPSNIMIGPYGRLHVMDFGLAKRDAGEITMTLDGQVLGTPAYMSPEQARGEAHLVDGRSDVYSLGVILYELLTGELPFRGTKRMLLHQVLNDEPRSPRRLNDTIPRDLETICLHAMAKEPGRRYASARALADDLRRFLAGEPIQARAAGRMERAVKWVKRRPATAALLAVSIVAGLALAAGAVSLFYSGQLQQERDHALFQKQQAEQARGVAEAEQDKAGAAEAVAKRQRERAELLVYARQLELAKREWESDNTAAAWEHLNGCQLRLRGWEHRYLLTLFNRNQVTFRGHTGAVSSVAFSPDGKHIASGSWDQTVKLWNVNKPQEVISLKGHSGTVFSLAFSADGKRIVSAGGDVFMAGKPGEIKVWDAASHQEILSLKGHTDRVISVAFSPNGKRVVSSSWDGRVNVWDVDTARVVFALKGHAQVVSSVAFSADGKRIAGGAGNFYMGGTPPEIKVWDADGGQEVLSLRGHTGLITSVTFSADCKRIVSSSRDVFGRGESGEIKVWDARGGQEVLSIKGHYKGIHSIAFSPDGQRIVSGSLDDMVKLWDVDKGQEVRSFKGHIGGVYSVAFSPDGQRIVSGGGDQTVKVWDVDPGQEALSLGSHTNAVSSIAFTRDGKRIVTSSWDQPTDAGEIKVWHGEIKVWDVVKGREVFSVKGHTDVASVAFSPDGKRILSGGGQTVKLWDADRGQEVLTIQGHTDRVHSVAFTPDGKRIASGSRDETVRVWEADTGRELLILKGHAGPVLSVAFSPDGQRIVSGGGEFGKPGQAKVWHADTGQDILTLKGHANLVLNVAFSPDGKRIASGSYDHTVKVWDADTGTEALTLKGHTNWVYGVAFSPDGKRIISGSGDATVKVWEADRGQELLSLNGHRSAVTSVAFSPDGKRIASGSQDKTVKVWEASQAAQPLQPQK